MSDRNVVLITAKGQNSTLKNKNLIKISGKTSFLHSVDAAKNSNIIDEIFVSSDSEEILDIATKNDCIPLCRPVELCQADSNHGDVIIYEYQRIKKSIGVRNLTICLGNTAMVFPEDIIATHEKLNNDKNATAAMTVWVAQDDHPFRAMTLNEDGYLTSFSQVNNVDTNRQSYPEVFFYDQGPWTVRGSTLDAAVELKNGPGPWWWMGDRACHIIRPWVTGRDTHSKIDVLMAEAFLKIRDQL